MVMGERQIDIQPDFRTPLHIFWIWGPAYPLHCFGSKPPRTLRNLLSSPPHPVLGSSTPILESCTHHWP